MKISFVNLQRKILIFIKKQAYYMIKSDAELIKITLNYV